jgi:hypothetical protein
VSMRTLADGRRLSPILFRYASPVVDCGAGGAIRRDDGR